MVNQGVIDADVQSNWLTVDPWGFFNQGLVEATNGAYLNIAPSLFGNLSNGVLTGGTYEAAAYSWVNFNQSISTLAADVLMTGAGANVGSIAYNLTTITAAGTLELDNGASTNDGNAIDNSGAIALGGGALWAADLTVESGATVKGYGAVHNAVTDDGLVESNGGALAIAGAVTGSGELLIDDGSTMELGQGSTATVTFADPGTLKLDSPQAFAASGGAIAGLGIGDTIDLAHTAVSGYALEGTTLKVYVADGSTLTFDNVTGAGGAPLANVAFQIQSDGADGTDLVLAQSVSQLAKAVINTPLGAGGTLTLADAHVSATKNDQTTISVANSPQTLPADGLDASVGPTSGAAYGQGSVASLAPDATNSASLSVGVDNTSAGLKSGTVDLLFASDGTVSNGGVGATTPLPTVDLTVTGSVYRLANAQITPPSNVIVHVGSGTVTETLTVANADPVDGYSEELIATASGVSGTVAGDTGSVELAAGASNSSSLAVTFSTATAGYLNGVAQVSLTSDGTGVNSLGETSLGTAYAPVSLTVDSYAVAAFAASGGTLTHVGNAWTLNFGAVAQGSADPSVWVRALNAAGGPADALDGDYAVTNTSGAFDDSGFGNFSGLGAQGTDVGGGVTLSTSQAGAFSETIDLDTTGSNASGYSASLQEQTLTITGDVIAAAQPQITPNPVNFGIVHVGDVVDRTLTVANAAPSGAEELDASIQSVTNGATASGSIVDLAAQSSSTAIEVGLATATAGVVNGTVTLATNSDLGGGATALPSTRTVHVNGTVDNFAVSQVEKLSGDGTLTLVNGVYVLNLGTTALGGADLTADLGLLNAAFGPADVLGASFGLQSGDPEYANSSVGAVNGIGAQSSAAIGSVDLKTTVAGTFTETLNVYPVGSNASGYSGALPVETVQIIGTVTAPPPAPPVTGVLWGDVHLVTWDGLAYNFQAAGEFVAAESTTAGNSYKIEVRTAPWSAGSTVSVMTEIAAEVGSARVTFGLNRSDIVWIDGVGQTLSVGQSVGIGSGAGTLTETSSNTYKLTWSTGKSAQITNAGSYFNLNTTLAQGEGAGSVKGLLGSDSGQANDFQLADGTVLTSLTASELYGEFANAWRIPDGAQGLFDYGAGETTDNFTDKGFPNDTISLSSLPQNLVDQAAAEVAAAGITDPGLSLDAELDLIVTGNLGTLAGSQNAQQSGVTTTSAQITGTLTPPPMAGVTAALTKQVENAPGVTAVTFTAYLTSAATTDTLITYAVRPDAGNVGSTAASLAAFGGALPQGSVTIAAGQTSADFTIDMPNAALGAAPSEPLEVQILAPSGMNVFAPTAETVIVNDLPVPGAPAEPAFFEASGWGQLQLGVLNLGAVVEGQSAGLRLGVANNAATGADNLAGAISDSGTGGFSATGDGALPTALSPGQTYQGLTVQVGTAALGQQTETVTLNPLDQNETGYSGSLAPVTITIEDTVLAPAAATIDGAVAQTAAVDIGTVRVGSAPSGTSTAGLSIANIAAAGAANLDAWIAGVSNGVTASGALTGLAAGQASAAVEVGLDTSVGGAKVGVVTIGLQSDAGGGQTLSLPSQTVSVTGTVYQEAQISVAPVNAVVHVGNSTVQALRVSNVDPANGYSEGAVVSEISVSGAGMSAVAGGPATILAGRSSTALELQLASTATAGQYSGQALLDLKTEGGSVVDSQGAVSSDGFGETDLGTSAANVTIDVYNHASAAFEKTSGAGTLTETGTNAYTLDLGAYAQGRASSRPASASSTRRRSARSATGCPATSRFPAIRRAPSPSIRSPRSPISQPAPPTPRRRSPCRPRRPDTSARRSSSPRRARIRPAIRRA